MSTHPSITATCEKLLGSLPTPLRAAIRHLPHRLGLVGNPRGTWDEFVRLDPTRNLPLYAGEASSDRHEVAACLQAHHCQAVFGLIGDRIADGQVSPEPDILALRRFFLSEWKTALARAAGPRSRSRIACGIRSWKRGVASDRAFGSGRRLDLGEYVRTVRLKLEWSGLSARCLVENEGDGGRLEAWDRTYAMFMIGLQCMDDAVDLEEDRATRGAAVPDALGIRPQALLSVIAALVPMAEEQARDAGFMKFATWLESFQVVLDPWICSRVSGEDFMEGLAIAQSIRLIVRASPSTFD